MKTSFLNEEVLIEDCDCNKTLKEQRASSDMSLFLCQGCLKNCEQRVLAFVMSVFPSMRPPVSPHELLGSHWRIFMKYDIWIFFRTSVENIKFSLKSEMKRRRRTIYIFSSYIAHLFLEWEMFQMKILEEIKTQILCLVTFFENLSVYEIMWKYTGEPDRTQSTRALHVGYLRL